MKRNIGVFVALVLLLASFSIPARAQSEKKEVVRIGYVPVMVFAPLYVAAERGYFAQEGIDIQLIPSLGATEAVVQLAAGNFDAAAAGTGAGFFNAVSKGLDFKIVAPMHAERPPFATPLVISAKRADEIKSVRDLKGKKIGISAAGVSAEYLVGEALRRAGLTFADVQIVVVPFPQVAPALVAGSVDAALLSEPLRTQQIAQGTVAVLVEDFTDSITLTYLFFGKPLYADRPQVAAGFMRAYLRACRDLQGNAFTDSAVAAIVEKYTKVPASAVQQARRVYYEPNGMVPAADIDRMQTYFLGRGSLEYTQPIDFAPYIDRSLAEAAVKMLGPYAEPTAAATPAS